MRGWGAFFLLVLATWVLRTSAFAIYEYVKKRVDERVPDELPIGAGAWLREWEAENCLGLRVYAGAPGSSHVDAYVPSANVITLSRDVYVKKDPSFWAVAAHELGHAIVYRLSPLLAAPLQLGRLVLASATSLATVLIFANVLYARRDLDAIAFALLDASLVGFVLLLVDEALASVVGLRILRRDPRIDRRGMLAGSAALGAAFITYLAGFVGQILLVAQRRFVVAQIERHRHFVPGHPLGAARWVAVAVLSALLVALVARALVLALRSRKEASPAELEERQRASRLADVGRGLCACTVVALVYDQPGAPYLPLVCAAGVLASRTFVTRISSIVLGTMLGLLRSLVFLAALPFVFAVVIVRPSKPRPRPDPNVVPSPLAPSGPAPSALDALPLPEAIDDWSIGAYRDPPWHARLSELAFPLLHVAFVVGVFVELLGR